MLRFKFLHKNVQQNIIWMNLEFLKNTRNHPNIIKNLFHPKHQTRVEQESWYYDEYSKDLNHLIWIAYDEKKSCPIGYIQYHIETLIHRRCQVHYVVSNEFEKSKYDNKLIKWSVDNVKSWNDEFHRLTAYIFPEDSKRLENYCSEGFEIDGILREYVYRDCLYRDVMVLSKLI